MPTTAQMMRKQGYMPAAEVARRVGVSSAAVHGWVDNAQVEFARVGRRCYIKVDSLVRHLGQEAATLLGLRGEGGV